ncbi:MAG: divalent-cation tolerance protein CutA [Acidobacteriales bacterium]|nr:divalent-cation tolerance protein CutA [Terriglobales bacterium]
MTNKRIVLTTAGSQKEARKIARALIERRLAACVNIVPGVESVYRWKSKVERAREWLLVVKTTKARAGDVERTIKAIHSYEMPEVVVIGVESGSRAYLDWVGESIE